MYEDDYADVYPIKLPKTCPNCGKDGLQTAWIHRYIDGLGAHCASCGALYYLLHDEAGGLRLAPELNVELIEPVDFEQTKGQPLEGPIRYRLCDNFADEWEDLTDAQGERILRLARPYDPKRRYAQMELELWRYEPDSVDPGRLKPVALYCYDEWMLISQEKREAMLAEAEDPNHYNLH